MSFYLQLLNEKRRLLSELDSAEKEIDTLPPGNIQISKSNDSWKWRCSTITPEPGNSLRYVIPKKNRELAEKLCYKKYLLEKFKILKEQLTSIDEFMSKYPFFEGDNCISPNPEFQALLSSYRMKHEGNMVNWEHEDYTKKTDYPEGLIIPTKAGVLVRSKSEAIIANALTDMGIHFHYEQALNLNEMVIFPDFTILHPKKRELIFWEHFGMLDYENYAQTALKKLNSYFMNGYYPGKNLIVTFESKADPLDVAYIEHLILFHFS